MTTDPDFRSVRRILVGLFGAMLLFSRPVLAQEEAPVPPDTVLWNPSMVARVAGSQVGFQNWAEGGVNTLGLNLGLDGALERADLTWWQSHELRLAYGVVKQDTLDFRKSEDIIRIASTLQYLGDGFFRHLHPTIAVSFRSQFAPGYNYKENPFNDGRRPPVKVSDFMSPGTFQQSIGLSYTPNAWLKQRFGVAAKETVVSIESLRTLYGVTQDKSVRVELGLESFTEFDRDLFENVHYKSSLGLFAAFNKPESPDLLWENLLSLKVNSWLNVTFEWAILYDTDVSSKAQFKEVVAVGISYTIL